jgi:inosine/xanthosine triphosphatase
LKERVLVRVGSANRAKLEAVRRGLVPFFASVEVASADVASGVDAQPLGFREIVAGARNRARAAHAPGACDLAAGIEDGLIELAEVPSGWVNVGCCVLFDGEREALGFTAGFEYPPACVARATATPRTPIGDAFDALFRPPPGFPDPHGRGQHRPAQRRRAQPRGLRRAGRHGRSCACSIRPLRGARA